MENKKRRKCRKVGREGGYKLLVRRSRVVEEKRVVGCAELVELFSNQIFSCCSNEL
jgi:hypothetical protein